MISRASKIMTNLSINSLYCAGSGRLRGGQSVVCQLSFTSAFLTHTISVTRDWHKRRQQASWKNKVHGPVAYSNLRLISKILFSQPSCDPEGAFYTLLWIIQKKVDQRVWEAHFRCEKILLNKENCCRKSNLILSCFMQPGPVLVWEKIVEELQGLWDGTAGFSSIMDDRCCSQKVKDSLSLNHSF